MDFGLVFGLVKVALEVFQDERRDRFQNQYDKLEARWQNEMAKDDDDISDLALDRIMFECEQLARRIIAERKSDGK